MKLCSRDSVRPADGAPVFETWDAWTKYQNVAELALSGAEIDGGACILRLAPD